MIFAIEHRGVADDGVKAAADLLFETIEAVDKSSRIRHAPIGKLRSLFGPQFAKGCTDAEALREAL